MKSISLLRLLYAGAIMFWAAASYGQKTKTPEKEIKAIATAACGCTDEIATDIPRDSIVAKINSCITAHIMMAQMGSINMDELKDKAEITGIKKDTVQKEVTITIVADKDFDEIQAYMFKNCPRVKTLMASHDIQSSKSMSNNKKALQYYNEGLAYKAGEKYDMAIVSFNKAVKEDKKFAFAWDNLGICYRKNGNYKEAIKCYEKSLEADPTGGMPRQNIAIAYEYLKDYKKASEAYMDVIKYDAKNPEGYYGAGRAFYLDGNNEKGLDYMFKAYVMYQDTNSPYINDAKQFLGTMLANLKEKGKEDLFKQAAKNNGVNIE